MKPLNEDRRLALTHNRRIIYAAVLAACAIVLVAVLVRFFPSPPIEPKAAIIDQASSSQLSDVSRNVNETFVDETKTLLYKRFSRIDYYSDNATVDNYARLPSMGYRLIVWRAHSALDEQLKYVAISTSEPSYTKQYPQYSNGELTLCKIEHDTRMYYAITPRFIGEVMNGRFENAVVVLMTCNGLRQYYNETAEAITGKGAKVVISWDWWIDPSDNDYGSSLMFQHLINENYTIAQAVATIPLYSSAWGTAQLRFFPQDDPNVAEYRIPDYRLSGASYGGIFEALPISRKIFKLFISTSFLRVV